MNERFACSGNAADHCCYFGKPCKHLEEYTVPGRHWACGLYRVHGSWEAVYRAPEYVAVRQRAAEVGLPDFRCGDWPPPGQKCNTCGGVNNG